jgi:hypothetical protein
MDKIHMRIFEIIKIYIKIYHNICNYILNYFAFSIKSTHFIRGYIFHLNYITFNMNDKNIMYI